MLKYLHKFPEDVFHRVVLESLLGDEDVWSARLESRLKRAITIDPTIGSRSNFYMSFWRPFLLWLLWKPNSMKRKSSRLDLSHSSKGP
jgi:hypothetical protein